MFRYVLVFSALFVFFSCADNLPNPTKEKVTSNKKIFEEEDFYILLALRAEELRDFSSASQLYDKLYNRSQRKEYLYRALQNELSSKNYTKVIKRADKLLESNNDNKLKRFKIVALTALSKFEEAKTLALKLVEVTKEVNDYILLSNIYTHLQKPELALISLEEGYKIAGCSQYICRRLAKFYSDKQDIDSILSLYLNLYEKFKDAKVAQKIVEIYSYKEEKIKLLHFLESSQSDDKLLLDLYTLEKNYTKASLLANDIYLKTDDLNYLAKSAIYQYESTKETIDIKSVVDIVEKLKKVVVIEPIPLYLNYLGYLLIDKNIDIDKGIKYIKDALQDEPNSVYYLDSLAWGYYKEGHCKDAKKIMNTIVKSDTKNKELILHNNSIDRCLKKEIFKN